MDDMNPAMRDLFLGGEDEEWQDFIPPSARRAGAGGVNAAYLEIHIADNDDGSATVTFHTNDTNNDGTPDQTSWSKWDVAWDERWPSADEALRRFGASRVEPNGKIVTVFHNQVPIG
jgi:hypothetical protein